MKKRCSQEQIIGLLCEADADLQVKELCRKHGFSEASCYLWRSTFGGMSVPDAKRLKELETENTRLKKLLAERMRENEVIKDVLRKSRRTGPTCVSPPEDHTVLGSCCVVSPTGSALIISLHTAPASS